MPFLNGISLFCNQSRRTNYKIDIKLREKSGGSGKLGPRDGAPLIIVIKSAGRRVRRDVELAESPQEDICKFRGPR